MQRVIYTKDIFATKEAACALLANVYAGEPWVGSASDNFAGTHGKYVQCFTNIRTPLRVVIFQAEQQAEVLRTKETMRAFFNIGKHSIHITDTHAEAVSLVNYVFTNHAHTLPPFWQRCVQQTIPYLWLKATTSAAKVLKKAIVRIPWLYAVVQKLRSQQQ